MKNREWINELSDDELLKFFRGISDNGVSELICNEQYYKCDSFSGCYKCHLDWMNKEKVAQEKELKPCPFCSGKNISLLNNMESGLWSLRCEDCAATVQLSKDRDVVIDSWNRRSM